MKQPETHDTLGGFFSPVDDLHTVSTAKAGETIPVSWRITDEAGAGISDPASFKSLTSNEVRCSDFVQNPRDAVEPCSAGTSGM